MELHRTFRNHKVTFEPFTKKLIEQSVSNILPFLLCCFEFPVTCFQFWAPLHLFTLSVMFAALVVMFFFLFESHQLLSLCTSGADETAGLTTAVLNKKL